MHLIHDDARPECHDAGPRPPGLDRGGEAYPAPRRLMENVDSPCELRVGGRAFACACKNSLFERHAVRFECTACGQLFVEATNAPR